MALGRWKQTGLELSLIWLALTGSCVCIAQNCATIAKDFRKSIVHLKVKKVHKGTGVIDDVEGTGFILNPEGYLITNNHVVSKDEGIDSVEITGVIGSRNVYHIPVLPIFYDEQHDLALLQMENSSEPYAPVILGQPWTMSDGSKICSLGFPLGSEFHYTDGTIGGKIAIKGRWSTDIPSNRGESGAPVFADASGKVVAIKVGGYDDAQNLNLVIPINLAGGIIQQLSWHGELPSESKPAPPKETGLPTGNVTIYNGFRFYNQSVFNFSTQKIESWGSQTADLGVANPGGDNNLAVIFLANDAPPYTDPTSSKHGIENSGIREMPTANLDDVKECPASDYKIHYFQPQLGGVYCVRTRDGRHWAKIKVAVLAPDRIAFDYVYQPSGARTF
jgi:hypothetical protein